MPATTPSQQLRRDLKEAAALVKWSGVHLMHAALKLSEAEQEAGAREQMKIATRFKAIEDLKVGYADEVKALRVVRSKV